MDVCVIVLGHTIELRRLFCPEEGEKLVRIVQGIILATACIGRVKDVK